MDDDSGSDGGQETPVAKPSVWATATKNDFDAVDIEAPIWDDNSADCHDLNTRFLNATNEAKTRSDVVTERAYAMLAAICSFHFKPEERGEPFGPMFSSANGRSPIPNDFRGPPTIVLSTILPRVTNPVLASRIADTCWLNDRSNSSAAIVAIDAYRRIVTLVGEGKLSYRFSAHHAVFDLHSLHYLRRALQIGYAIGRDKPTTMAVRSYVAQLRADAVAKGVPFAIQLLSELDLDFDISPASDVAKDIERIIPAPTKPDEFFLVHALWSLAARAFHQAKMGEEVMRCRIAAAECLVAQAEANKTSAMISAHWLEMAVAEYQGIAGKKERRRELRHRLIDVQAGISDEMGSFSTQADIRPLIENTEALFKGKSLFQKLALFALSVIAPDPDELRKAAVEQIQKFPLSSLFSTTHHDHEGKVIYRSPGGGGIGDPNEEAIENQIAQAEKIRRGMASSGRLDVARQLIMFEHAITERDLGIICSNSPFVPQGHELTFSRGFARFFQGDMIGALYVLVPQLENSLRDVLKQYGHDVTKVNSEDMTQEDRTISSLFENMRLELNSIFGQAVVDDVDRVFLRKPGPHLRHQAAHGLLFDAEPFGDDCVYACALIFRLCCVPLLPHWKAVEESHAAMYGRA
jgi:hypothetical protein